MKYKEKKFKNTIIKDNAIIRANSIIGGEGYEFKRFDNIGFCYHYNTPISISISETPSATTPISVAKIAM